jgi:Glycosyl transferases group 1
MELGLLSNMLVNRQPYWQAYVPPLFSAIAGGRTNVRIVEPPSAAWAERAAWKSVRSQVKVCDTLFWLQLSSRPATEVHLASLNRLRARRSNFIIDAWKPALTKIGWAATIERLDPCFLAYLEATTELKRRFPQGKFVWLPLAVRTEIFYPRKDLRSNFAFYMGRRHEPLHQALLRYCEARGLKYLYSDKFLYGDELGQAASSAEYFVVSPREVIDPKTKTSFSPLPQRYFEGLAAGTRLLGPIPASGEYNALLPADAVCEVSLDGSDLAERLDRDRENPDNRRAGEAAAALVHDHHSWRRRGEQIYNYLEHGGPLELHLMPQARNHAEITAALTS